MHYRGNNSTFTLTQLKSDEYCTQLSIPSHSTSVASIDTTQNYNICILIIWILSRPSSRAVIPFCKRYYNIYPKYYRTKNTWISNTLFCITICQYTYLYRDCVKNSQWTFNERVCGLQCRYTWQVVSVLTMPPPLSLHTSEFLTLPETYTVKIF